jgi:putative transposase
MVAYRQLAGVGITTRAAAALTGLSRATATRRLAVVVPALITARAAPVNRLSAAEQAQVLAVLLSAEFVDQTPLQIFAILLERGAYLCSVSTMYRILRANALVKDRRRQARHPARARPELIATGPGQVFSWSGGRGHRSPRLPQIPA